MHDYKAYNPGQKSLGQYCNVHIFLSFLGSLLKLCILFEIFLQFSLPPPYTKLKLGKLLETRVQQCLWGEGRGWTCVNWKTPQKRKSVPRLLSMIVASKLYPSNKPHMRNKDLTRFMPSLSRVRQIEPVKERLCQRGAHSLIPVPLPFATFRRP